MRLDQRVFHTRVVPFNQRRADPELTLLGEEVRLRLCDKARPAPPVSSQSEVAVSQAARKFPRLDSAALGSRLASLTKSRGVF